MTNSYNAGVEAAAKVMDDLDRGGFFAMAIRERAKREDAMTDDDILDAMVSAAATHFAIKPDPDDTDTPAVRRCMESILARLRAESVVH